MADFTENVLDTPESRRKKISQIAEAAASEAITKKVNRMFGIKDGYNEDSLQTFLAMTPEERQENLDLSEALIKNAKAVRFHFGPCALLD